MCQADPMRRAAAIPDLFTQELRQVGSGMAQVDAPALWIAPASGFEMMVVLPARGDAGRLQWTSSVGQVTLAAQEPDESAVLDVLRRRHGQLAVEQVLCASGIVELHRAICLLRGVKARRLTSVQIVACAVQAESPECARAMAMFSGLLGDVAGRAALTSSAFGGVFIGGGVVPLLGDWFARSPFRRRFDGCGRYAQTMRAIPTFVVPASGSVAHANGVALARDVERHDNMA